MNNNTSGKQVHQIYGKVVILAFLCHILFICLFLFLQISQLVIYNFLSCLFYIVMFFVSQKGHFRTLVTLVHAEISLFSIVCCCFLGWELGYSFYLIALSTQVYFCPFKRKYIPYFFSLAEIFAFFVLKIYTLYHAPLVACSEQTITAFYLFNSLLSFSMILYTAFVSKVSAAMTEENNSQLQDLVNYDALTHLWSRIHLTEAFEQAAKDGVPMIIVMTDIDDFKLVNDTYGHNCGDYVLCHLAENISAMCPEHSGVCRWGGEEFVLMFKNCEMPDVFLLVKGSARKFLPAFLNIRGKSFT